VEDLETHTWTGAGGPYAPAGCTEILEQVAGPGAPRRVPLSGALSSAGLVIGRSETAHVQLRSPRVSRRHVLLERAGLELRATNLSEVNAMLLNRIPVHAADLRDGDRLQVGDAIFVFRRAGQ
jgi:pSer/pThr/pTyr-binding forkhead associated (FHA) protein